MSQQQSSLCRWMMHSWSFLLSDSGLMMQLMLVIILLHVEHSSMPLFVQLDTHDYIQEDSSA